MNHTFVEKPSKNFSVADHVICTNCGAHGLVTVTREDCPNCHLTGRLMWVNEYNQEVRIV